MPFSHMHLKEHVNATIHARLGEKFPKMGVGQQWTYWFLEKHSDKLHMYTVHALDTTCGQVVNEHANTKYFNMVEDLQLAW